MSDSDIHQQVEDIHDQLPDSVDVSPADIEDRLTTLVSDYKMPIDDVDVDDKPPSGPVAVAPGPRPGHPGWGRSGHTAPVT